MHASYYCNDNAIQFPCLEPTLLSLFNTASEQGRRWNITLLSNSRSLQDKIPSTLPSLTQYGFISMISYLISQVSETTHGEKLEHHCWLNWLDYGNVLTTFHIGHFAHSYREQVDFAKVWSFFSDSGGNTENINSDKTVRVGGLCYFALQNARFSCTVKQTILTSQQYHGAKRRLIPFYLLQLSVIWLDHTWA